MKNIALILLCISLLGVVGCATGSYAVSEENTFLSSYGDCKLVSRNNDLYMEKVYGGESRRITHTPNIKEDWPDSYLWRARFIKGGKYIKYVEGEGHFDFWKGPGAKPLGFYIVPIDKDDSARQSITGSEFYGLED